MKAIVRWVVLWFDVVLAGGASAQDSTAVAAEETNVEVHRFRMDVLEEMELVLAEDVDCELSQRLSDRLLLARAWQRLGESARAVVILDQTEALLEEIEGRTIEQRARDYAALASTWCAVGEMDRGRAVFIQAREAALQIDDPADVGVRLRGCRDTQEAMDRRTLEATYQLLCSIAGAQARSGDFEELPGTFAAADEVLEEKCANRRAECEHAVDPVYTDVDMVRGHLGNRVFLLASVGEMARVREFFDACEDTEFRITFFSEWVLGCLKRGSYEDAIAAIDHGQAWFDSLPSTSDETEEDIRKRFGRALNYARMATRQWEDVDVTGLGRVSLSALLDWQVELGEVEVVEATLVATAPQITEIQARTDGLNEKLSLCRALIFVGRPDEARQILDGLPQRRSVSHKRSIAAVYHLLGDEGSCGAFRDEIEAELYATMQELQRPSYSDADSYALYAEVLYDMGHMNELDAFMVSVSDNEMASRSITGYAAFLGRWAQIYFRRGASPEDILEVFDIDSGAMAEHVPSAFLFAARREGDFEQVRRVVTLIQTVSAHEPVLADGMVTVYESGDLVWTQDILDSLSPENRSAAVRRLARNIGASDRNRRASQVEGKILFLLSNNACF